ncbi:glutamine amidotransferase WbuY [Malaciobacter marinus]|uniref:Imidazole glycerol phosphate synthase subunit HisH n=1 Tax=Malaciobacter marinus TaxID=505249 RepID=A0A347TJ61_9BACT|nr:imidazole glycerol phosphate synthase subunit HisH [Malaciobacter marinus]AXX86639.1 glutamine amidotransferase WbuY [Malaciobacter marinus]PHO14684.1 imidazole glycerol phosphate synthase subunit HisH [Malaciobacter marinus]
MITIVDYGMGNLGSIKNMFKYIGVESTIENDVDKIKNASKILLPGVGSFDTAMKKINEKDLKEVLNEKALKEQVPVLGICLGMQLLTNSSEEGSLSGLGWIPAKTMSFKNRIDKEYKIPHMGWNIVNKSNESLLIHGFEEFDETRFYFVHSYFVKVENEKNSILKTDYGVEFDSAIQKDNIFGAQFHPEKSHKFGMKLFENFARI